MDTSRPVIQLCIQGTQAEYRGHLEAARLFYEKAWELANDDVERCIAAHYMARFQETPEERLHWNQEALDRANAVTDEDVKTFYPSLYLNLGQSYEALGNEVEAKRYFDLAASLGTPHQAFSK